MKSLAMVNLVGCLIVFLMALGKILPPWAQSRYKVEAPMENWSTLTLNDPKLNTSIASLPKDQVSRAILVISDCGQCNASKVSAFSGVNFGNKTKKVVYISNTITLEEAMKRFGRYDNVQFAILSETQKSALNVSFLPRVYLIDRDSRVRFVQLPGVSYGQAFWTIQKQARG